jgi:hypothetical protein
MLLTVHGWRDCSDVMVIVYISGHQHGVRTTLIIDKISNHIILLR